MKILMDADCLIKLIKAGLKESICRQYEIFIPFIIKKEVVDAGKKKGLPDAELAEKNIQKGIIRLVGKEPSGHIRGDRALVDNFKRGSYNAIATDDAKLTRLLRATGIPYILPGLFIYSLHQRNIIDRKAALKWLEDLSNFISEDEYSMIKFLLEGK
jgi:rRNA-processing protein FCF1